MRAAAVFALGRLIANTGNRSDHANMIDHSVATMLASTIGNDGSPLVRKVCVFVLRATCWFFYGCQPVHAIKPALLNDPIY